MCYQCRKRFDQNYRRQIEITMASNNKSVDDPSLTQTVEVKEEPEILVRKCRAKSQEIFNLETSYRELQRTARELGLPSNLKVGTSLLLELAVLW